MTEVPPGIQEGSDSVNGRFWIRGKITGCPQVLEEFGVPYGSRTRVAAVKKTRFTVIRERENTALLMYTLLAIMYMKEDKGL